MLILTCPHCGVDACETELSPGGEAHLKRHGPEAGDEDFASYLFMRENPRGAHLERWRHAYGCGKWFLAARDTHTMRVWGTYPATLAGPGDDLRSLIASDHAGWGPVDPNAEPGAPAPYPEGAA